jgi:hypothetical protein
MNKSELRQSFVDDGWTVQAVANWQLVSNVEGVVKYDANYVSPDNRFGTAQVIVTNDGVAGETAVASGAFVTPEVTFDAAVRDYVTSLEGVTVANVVIFAVAVTKTFPQDEIALATAYKADGSQANYVVKRRNGTFTPQALS